MTVNAYRVNSADQLIPFRAAADPGPDPDPDPDPPPPGGSRQLLGMAVSAGGAAWQGAQGNLANEEARLASLFDWPRNGPPVARIYLQTQVPPNGMTDIARTLNANRIPWLSVKPGAGGVANDKAGGSNARWTAFGNYFKQYWPKPIWFTYDHEVDRHTYSGGTNQSNIGYKNYQNDFVDTFLGIRDIFDSTDPTHGNDHVTFVSNFTGYAFRKMSNRDPGFAWHPDIDVVSSDPYDFYLYNDGRKESEGRRDLFENPGGFSTGAIEHYQWCMDPVNWYETYHPTWAIPSIITSNLDKFPVRMAIGETGFQFEMHPNGSNTQWVHDEDINSVTNSQARALTKMALDLRTTYQRMEVVIYWHNSTNAIGANVGSPNYFAGPAANRWGHQSPGSIEAFRRETSRAEHQGALTPWGPGGLL